MLFGVGVSCGILYSIVSYLYVSHSESITSLGEERELICLLAFSCNYVVFVQRDFLFLLVLGWSAFFYCGTPWTFHIII